MREAASPTRRDFFHLTFGTVPYPSNLGNSPPEPKVLCAVSKNEKKKEGKPTVYIVTNSVSLFPIPRLLALAVKNACHAAALQQSGIPFQVLLINLASTVTNPQSVPPPFPPSSPRSPLFLTTAISRHFLALLFSFAWRAAVAPGSGERSISDADDAKGESLICKW